MEITVYIIHSRLGHWYTGLSKNVENRLEQHRAQSVISTRNKGFFELVFSQTTDSYASARKLEKEIKRAGAYKWLRKQLFSAYLFKSSKGLVNVALLKKKGIILPYHLIHETNIMQVSS